MTKNKKTKKIRKRKGGGGEWQTTPITDKKELQKLKEADRIAEEKKKHENEIKRFNDELERQRIQGWSTTPMSQKDARRQQEQDLLDNALVNSPEAKLRKLTVADLGGSKKRKQKRTKKGKKSKKHKKTRGGNRIGGNNIGANCNDPNFSIYNTNLLKLFPYKGGELQLDDPYKNAEGSQF
jgi:hypothetical protein